MSVNVKVFTLRATCKVCGGEFRYTRRHNLVGAERKVCDGCRPRRRDRKSPLWTKVVSES